MRARWNKKQSRCCSRVLTRNCSRRSTSRRPSGSGEQRPLVVLRGARAPCVQVPVFLVFAEAIKNAYKVLLCTAGAPRLCVCSVTLQRPTKRRYDDVVLYFFSRSIIMFEGGSVRCCDVRRPESGPISRWTPDLCPYRKWPTNNRINRVRSRRSIRFGEDSDSYRVWRNCCVRSDVQCQRTFVNKSISRTSWWCRRRCKHGSVLLRSEALSSTNPLEHVYNVANSSFVGTNR